MKITALSDLHGHYPDLEGGDLLILCGDYTAEGKFPEWARFFEWLTKQNYTKKIVVAGNHDNYLYDAFPKDQKESDNLKEVQSFLIELGEMEKPDFEYLCDSGIEFEGLKIWGSPWSLWFKGINPKCKYFTGTEYDLEKKYRLIPHDIDILITHTPPWGVLDQVNDYKEGIVINCGCLTLNYVLDKIQPRFHFFGHIHGQGGKSWVYNHTEKATTCFNTSIMDEEYEFTHAPIEIEI